MNDDDNNHANKSSENHPKCSGGIMRDGDVNLAGPSSRCIPMTMPVAAAAAAASKLLLLEVVGWGPKSSLSSCIA